MIELQKIDFPSDCTVIHHEFYTYDPLNTFNEKHSLEFLDEDLLQCTFEEDNMTIDLGWYGNTSTNKGEFKLQMIKDENWEIPFETIHSKSVDEIKSILIKVLHYYTSTEITEAFE
tara:strand:- start:3520 stop:3867 length:348 start_codon:yes stop_codon:yes gene_type:complete